jgi:hypothetical protein
MILSDQRSVFYSPDHRTAYDLPDQRTVFYLPDHRTAYDFTLIKDSFLFT